VPLPQLIIDVHCTPLTTQRDAIVTSTSLQAPPPPLSTPTSQPTPSPAANSLRTSDDLPLSASLEGISHAPTNAFKKKIVETQHIDLDIDLNATKSTIAASIPRSSFTTRSAS